MVQQGDGEVGSDGNAIGRLLGEDEDLDGRGLDAHMDEIQECHFGGELVQKKRMDCGSCTFGDGSAASQDLTGVLEPPQTCRAHRCTMVCRVRHARHARQCTDFKCSVHRLMHMGIGTLSRNAATTAHCVTCCVLCSKT